MNTDELERLAREIQPEWDMFRMFTHPEARLARYIAAASPDVILALLEERRVLREVALGAQVLVNGYGMQSAEGDRLTGHGYLLLVTALSKLDAIQAEPARAEEGAS